ncbi:hypothetical protein C9374_012397 [Naegleria lovaniensis]|uniref:Peptidase S9 prolyl oligopeptidase catalytic domain-containing protein n=1 Tax=Naegleria lovaniensis TaxID=51637 RepID=A0AA88GZN3_NAELO|nr:uncharacterized protein C9374_012397 [Naegleria lovaniensis]KAG2392145.1 hypothetical protein C9374_012397 [Naegleria lovaniensis]
MGLLDDIPSSEKVRKSKLTCKQLSCRITLCLSISCAILCAVIAALIIIAWFSVGSVLWNMAFGVDLAYDCDEFRANSPSNFTINYRCPPLVEPVSQWETRLAPFFVNPKNVEIVHFPSRTPGWVSGFGPANITATLMKHDLINSTSKFIITIHGYKVCRYRSESMLPSTMLYHMGYNILQVDLRNHGDSGIYQQLPYVSFGNFEHLDILGGMDFIFSRYSFLNKTDSIGLFGTSMGGATALVSFSLEKNFKVAFVDSPPCDVVRTLQKAAEDIAGNAISSVAMNAIKSMVPVKAPAMGFPPFYNDPYQLLTNVDLSGNRKLFFLHIEDDSIVPTVNHYICLNATKLSIEKNQYSANSVESYLGTIEFPYDIKNRTRTYCNKHLSYMFVHLDEFRNMLYNFFKVNL